MSDQCFTTFTGSEWDYVIISTVRSKPMQDIDEHPSRRYVSAALGFLTDKHQMNVAITRAKRGLIIVGRLPLS